MGDEIYWNDKTGEDSCFVQHIYEGGGMDVQFKRLKT